MRSLWNGSLNPRAAVVRARAVRARRIGPPRARNLRRIAGALPPPWGPDMEAPGEIPDGVSLREACGADFSMSVVAAWSIRALFGTWRRKRVRIHQGFVDNEFGRPELPREQGEVAGRSDTPSDGPVEAMAIAGGVGALYAAARCLRARRDTREIEVCGSSERSASVDVRWELEDGTEIRFERRTRALTSGMTDDEAAARRWLRDHAREKAAGLATTAPATSMRVVLLGGLFHPRVAAVVHERAVDLVNEAYVDLDPTLRPHAIVVHAFAVEGDARTITPVSLPHAVELRVGAIPPAAPNALAAFRAVYDPSLQDLLAPSSS